MRLGSYYAEGGQARACGLGGDGSLAGLNRADPGLPAGAAVPPAAAAVVR